VGFCAQGRELPPSGQQWFRLGVDVRHKHWAGLGGGFDLRAVELRVPPHEAEAVFVEEAAAGLGRQGVLQALFAVLLHALLEVVHLVGGLKLARGRST